jgi:hypothetical protein
MVPSPDSGVDEGLDESFPKQTPAGLYSFSRPGSVPVVACAREYDDIQQMLGNKQFVHPYDENATRVISYEQKGV